MSRAVSVFVSIRAHDVKKFVEDFAKKYPDLVEEGNLPESECDVIACVLGGLDYEDIEQDSDDECWYACGIGECNGWWAFEGYDEFFEWCVPYVDSKSRFGLSVEGGGNVFWYRNYAIEGGCLKVASAGLRVWDEVDLAPPTVSQIIDFLKVQRPTARVVKIGCDLDGRYAVIIGLRGYGWPEVDAEDGDPDCMEPEDVRCEPAEHGSDDAGREFGYFVMTFKATKKSVSDVVFDGPVLKWNGCIAYDNGLKAKDLTAAIQKFVKLDSKRKITAFPTY